MRSIVNNLITSALLAAALLAPATASADLRFCNKTWKGLEVSVEKSTSACSSQGGWGNWGWYFIPVNKCVSVVIGSLPNRYYYYHADSYDDKWTWTSSSHVHWLPQADHTAYCINRGPNGTPGGLNGHRTIDTGDYTDYRIDLTTSTPNPCASRGPNCYPGANDQCLCG